MIFEYLLLTIIILVTFFLKSSWFKGAIGEFKVNSIIKKRLNKVDYKILKDVLLPAENGTTQIDHIIVSKYGIFVIETKNFSNWIFSNVGPFWTQVIYKKKYKFQNPIRQNYKHVKTIERLLGEPEKNIINVVVFAGDCEFKTDVPNGVVKLRRLISYINSFQDQVIDDNQVENYVGKIENYRLENTIKNKIQHIRNIDKIIFEKGYDRPTFEDKIKKQAYNILILLLFLLIIFSYLGKISKQSTKNIHDITKNNSAKVENIRKNTKDDVQKQYQSKYTHFEQKIIKQKPTAAPQQIHPYQHTYKPVQQKTHPYTELKPNVRHRAGERIMYSWIDDKGNKHFSNVGFPKNKKYTNGSIGWY
nr:nuclease-related domain-containing protein [uncultured Desulfobulbus sp.]